MGETRDRFDAVQTGAEGFKLGWVEGRKELVEWLEKLFRKREKAIRRNFDEKGTEYHTGRLNLLNDIREAVRKKENQKGGKKL